MKSSHFFFPALLILAVSACGVGPSDSPDDDARVLPDGVGMIIVESDRAVGGLELFEPVTHVRTTNTGADFDPDMAIRRLVDPRTGASRFFLVQATFERVLEIDRGGHIVGKIDVSEPGTSKGKSDPLDLAIAKDGALWVTRHGSKSLAVLEPDGRPRCTIDLSSFADADGKPEMSAIAILGTTAYVALRRLKNGFEPIDESTVVSIDTGGCGPAKAFLTLPAKNPWQRFAIAGTFAKPELWVNCIAGPVSSPPVRGGGLVKIDVASAKATVALTDDAAGGFVDSFDLVDDRTAFAIVASYDDPNPTTLIRFDPSTGVRDASFRPVATSGYTLWSVAKASSVLLIADRNPEKPGIRVLSADDGASLGFVPTRLPPVELLVLRQ